MTARPDTGAAAVVAQARAMTTRESTAYLKARGWQSGGGGRDWYHPAMVELWGDRDGVLTLPPGVVSSHTRRAALLTALHADRRERWSDTERAWVPIPPGEPDYPRAARRPGR